MIQRLKCWLGNHRYFMRRRFKFYDHEGGRYYDYDNVCIHCGCAVNIPSRPGPPLEWDYEDKKKKGETI